MSSSARPPRLLQAAEVLGHFARLLVRVRTPEQTILTLGSMALSVFFVDADCTNIQLNAMGLLCEIFAQYPANRLHFVGELCDLLPKLPKVGNHAQPHRRRASVHVARRWGTAPPYTTFHAGGESCVFRVAQAKKLHRCYKLGNGKSVQMISERSWEFI